MGHWLGNMLITIQYTRFCSIDKIVLLSMTIKHVKMTVFLPALVWWLVVCISYI